jgi:hypothetical protein
MGDAMGQHLAILALQLRLLMVSVPVRLDGDRFNAREKPDSVAVATRRWQADRSREHELELRQEVIHQVVQCHEQVWQGWQRICCRPKHALAILNKGHQAPAKVPDNGAERFKPLHAQHHLIGGNLQPIAINGEGFSTHVDAKSLVAAQACETITVRHCHSQPRRRLQDDACVLSRRYVDEVVCRSGVKQGPKTGAIDHHQ